MKSNLTSKSRRLLASYKNKDHALLGLGLENQALLKLLDRHKISVRITICDARPLIQIEPLVESLKLKYLKPDYQLEERYNRDLEKYDFLWRSPGWPIACPGVRLALKADSTLDSPMNLFFQLSPSRNIIGVTGTKGKGTTSSLIAAVLKAAGKKVYLGGNIGIAPLNFVDKIRSSDYIVLELSSFQLEDLRFSPKLAVITNLYREHLAPADPLNPNYHKSFKAYQEAKLNIARFQKNTHYFLLNEKFNKLFNRKAHAGKILYFSASDTPSKLYGIFNRENIAAAELVGKILHLKEVIVKRAVNNFTGLEHRLELVRELNGARYFDNSFSTTPESSILDLKSFKAPIILLAGGADKGADFKAFAKTINQHVEHLFLFPGDGSRRLLAALGGIKFPKNKLTHVRSMNEAVAKASERATIGATVLLSTGCASFGLFKNYKERGNQFKGAVESLPE